MKKTILLFLAVLTAVFSNAQVKAVRCTEEDYNQALQSQLLCSCADFTPADLSQTESRQIDSVLHQHYFVAKVLTKRISTLNGRESPINRLKLPTLWNSE